MLRPEHPAVHPANTWLHMTRFNNNRIIKFADDTAVAGLVSNNDESAYRMEVEQLTGLAQIPQSLPQRQQNEGYWLQERRQATSYAADH